MNKYLVDAAQHTGLARARACFLSTTVVAKLKGGRFEIQMKAY
jgi:hypothetical protein